MNDSDEFYYYFIYLILTNVFGVVIHVTYDTISLFNQFPKFMCFDLPFPPEGGPFVRSLMCLFYLL